MTHDEYCIDVCKAKCCKTHSSGLDCPKLIDGCKCSIYQHRFGEGSLEIEIVDWVEHPVTKTMLPFICSRITYLIRAKMLPPEIEKQCCYAHPEILGE